MQVLGGSVPLMAELGEDLLARVDSGRAVVVLSDGADVTVLHGDEGELLADLIRAAQCWGYVS